MEGKFFTQMRKSQIITSADLFFAIFHMQRSRLSEVKVRLYKMKRDINKS